MNAAATYSDTVNHEILFPEVTWDEVFRIETSRLWLRWPKISDAAEIAKFAGLPEVAEMTANIPVGVSAEETASHIRKSRQLNGQGRALRLALTLKTKPQTAIGLIGLGTLAGSASAGSAGYSSADLGLGYHLAPAFWGQGLMSEAVGAILFHAFHLTAAQAIVATVRTFNPGSKRVLEKCGFVPFGVETSACGLRGDVEKEKFRLRRGGQAMLKVA